MANEVTIPLLPCRSIDEITEFYGALGFTTTYRQTRPNPYVAVQREDLQLHFGGIEGFDPEQSYGSCVVIVPDTGAIHQAFAEAMRAAYGKVLVSGIPRMTSPRQRKNTGKRAGFSVVDPGGNWIRFFPATEDKDVPDESSYPTGRLTKALENAVVLGDSKGDAHQAARILDSTLTRERDSAHCVELIEALVYRAELALRLDDDSRARALLTEVGGVPLGDGERTRLTNTLAVARQLEGSLPTAPTGEGAV
ncbi:VOC family protein [Streptomyces phaeochromogenes]|uniref:VOC family protein n=1 Tax=Streptomyces phaeochromogenes TaxID=1923 RepID=UPI002DDA3C32|nr:VOC family protein [Streptomyces phaeochromogenes]WRZ31165.1 VOC family protein [Streptomyces phaeochromogenes]